jgi:hypothetical protein
MIPISVSDSPWRVAVHESGHAAAAAALGVPFSYVTSRVNLHQDSEGHLWRVIDPGTTWYASILVSLAGVCAEVRALGHDELGARDLPAARTALAACFAIDENDPEIDVWLARLRQEADELVREEWPVVIAVARRLLRRQVLFHHEFLRIRDSLASRAADPVVAAAPVERTEHHG